MNKPCVLVADDDSLVTDLLEFRLNDIGCRSVCYRDGSEVVEAMKTEVPDLVIIDYLLPGVSANQIIEQIRQDARCGDIPILVLSVAWREQDVLAILRVPNTESISKPFSPDEIIDQVRRRLGLDSVITQDNAA